MKVQTRPCSKSSTVNTESFFSTGASGLAPTKKSLLPSMMAPVSTAWSFPPRSAYNETVQVKIGPDPGAKVFTIYKDILIFYSGYFEGALRHPSTFKEAQDGIFWLPDEEIDTWKRFVLFLYSGKIDLTDPPLSIASSSNPSLDLLCRLWVLGDRREVPLLVNKCIDAIKYEVINKWHNRPVHMLPYVYANTAPGSALRRFVLLLTARAGASAQISPFDPSIAHCFDEESLRDVLHLIWNIEDSRILSPLNVYIIDTCAEYHCHEAGEREKCGEEK